MTCIRMDVPKIAHGQKVADWGELCRVAVDSWENDHKLVDKYCLL